MGAVGQWDGALFERFRVTRPCARCACVPREEHLCARRRLFGELARVHAPLVAHLVKQALRSPRAGGAWRLGSSGVEHGIPSEALRAGELAFAERLPDYDPRRASLATYLALPILFKVQKAIQATGLVVRGVKQRVAEFDCVGDDETPLDGCTEADEAREPTALREAILGFLEEHLVFTERARVAALSLRERYESVVVGQIAAKAASTLRGRYEGIMLAREEAKPRGMLTRALLERGARRVMVRSPWTPAARGFAGVRLRNEAGDLFAPESRFPGGRA